MGGNANIIMNRDGTPKNNEVTDAFTQQLLRWLESRMPGAHDLHLTNLRKPSGGMSSDTHLFTVHWRQDPSDSRAASEEQSLDAALRCAPRADGPFPEYDLAMQFGIMRQLAAHTNVPVPEVLWQEDDSTWLGVPFLSMKAVIGEPPLDWPSYHASGFYSDLSESKRRKLWTRTIESLAEIHRADWKGINLDFVPGGRPEDDPASHLLTYWRRYLDEWTKDDPTEIIPVYDEVLDWLERNRPDCPRTSLVWGDAKLGNVMYKARECEVAAVIDWELAMIGDSRSDLASLRISDLRAQEAAGRSLPGTPSESELIELYESASGETVGDFRYFLLYSAFWRGAVTLKVMRRMKAQGQDISNAMMKNHFPVPYMRDLLASLN